MDRKSRKKIATLLFLGIMLMILISCGIYAFAKGEFNIQKDQVLEIITIHPELESEITDNFQFYEMQTRHLIVRLWLFLILLYIVYFVVLFFLFRKEVRQEYTRITKEIDLLCEQLEKFHQSDFNIMPYYLGVNEDSRWSRVHELVIELGYYFCALKEKLIQEENSTKALITDISHQLKTPLASLKMSHELSKSENLSRSERQEFLEAEEHEISKLEILLAELVHLSRLEVNMIQIKTESRNIRPTITEAVNQVFMKAHYKNIELNASFEMEPVVIHDSKWTVEALVNVLDNAIKYSKDGTKICIRIRSLIHDVLIEIEDEGIGIPEEDIHKIFKRFFRGKEAQTYAKDGAGVGLYLARSIVEQQGGTILAKRKIGQGSIFKITLPLGSM